MIWFAAPALLGIVAFILGAARIVQNRLAIGNAKAGRLLILQESLAIDPRRRIHVVSCGGSQLLLLTSGQRDVVIGWLPRE